MRIARAIPPGHRRAGQAHRWLARVREAALAEFRADAAERRIALATVAARHLDVTTGTYAGGWSRLASLVGCSRSTVARWLVWLRARSLLGVVSTGRPADLTTPMPLAGGLAAAGPGWHRGGLRGPDGRPVNEAAVYVPCEPDTPRARRDPDPDPGLLVLDPRWHTGQLTFDPDGRAVDRSRHPRAADDPRPLLPLSTAQPTPPATPLSSARGAGAGQVVDETDTPVRSSGAGTQPGRAHATTCTHHPARAGRPLRGRNNAAPRQHLQAPPDPARPAQSVTAGPPDPRTAPAAAAGDGWCPQCGPWPATQPATTRGERLRLAHQLRRVSPDLHQISARLLRHLLRPWLTAGWTLTDLLHAIDHHPTTGPRHHSPTGTGPGTIRNPPGWLLHRLHDWTGPDGTPLPSHRQRTTTARATSRYTPPPTGNTSNIGNSPAGDPPAGPITWPPVRQPPDPHTP